MQTFLEFLSVASFPSTIVDQGSNFLSLLLIGS